MGQIIMVLVGLFLAVVATLGVAPSMFQSGDGAAAAMMAQEVSAIRNAANLWVANKSPDGNFNGMNAAELGGAGNILQDLSLDGSTPQKLLSRAKTGVTYTVAANAGNKSYRVTIDGLGAGAKVEPMLANHISKLPGTMTNSDPADGILVMDFNG